MKDLVGRLGTPIVTIYVDTPVAVARRRLQSNRLTGVRVNRTDVEFDEILHAMEPPEADEWPLIFSHDCDSARWIDQHLGLLTGLGLRAP